jgi:hypothetical protein
MTGRSRLEQVWSAITAHATAQHVPISLRVLRETAIARLPVTGVAVAIPGGRPWRSFRPLRQPLRQAPSQRLAEVWVFAKFAVELVLNERSRSTQDGYPLAYRCFETPPEVHQTTGMISVQLGVTMARLPASPRARRRPAPVRAGQRRGDPPHPLRSRRHRISGPTGTTLTKYTAWWGHLPLPTRRSR